MKYLYPFFAVRPTLRVGRCLVLVLLLSGQTYAAAPVLSPDGRQSAYLQDKEIWLSDAANRDVKRIVAVQPHDNPHKNLGEFNSLVFSPDGKRLYFMSEAWVTSNGIHVFEISTGTEHFVTDGNTLQILSNGQYAGFLIVQKHKYFKQGGSYDYFWLVSPAGKVLKMIGKTDAQVDRFVRVNRSLKR
jgi:dipeptidyl aminopeptidase/acylaminoacyl peptidase